VLGLHWDDIDFDGGKIRWRAEHDKLRKTWVVPAARSTLDELVRLAAYWLRRAYELSGVTKPEGSMWHAFRRLWATARKAFPVKDVAAAGGWKDVNTLIDCYQQPDDDTCGPWWSS